MFSKKYLRELRKEAALISNCQSATLPHFGCPKEDKEASRQTDPFPLSL